MNRWKKSYQCGHAWRVTLFLVLFLAAVSALVAPNAPLLRRSRTHLHLQLPSTAPIRKNIEDYVKRSVPPISDQEEEKFGFVEQFRPRFVAREFLLGVRIMCLIHPLLMAGSIAMHVLRMAVLNTVDTVPSQLAAAASSTLVSPFHVLEVQAKLSICGALGVAPRSPVMHTLIGPVFEEISYRGLGQWLGAFVALFRLWLFAGLCRFLTPEIAFAGQAYLFVDKLRLTISNSGSFAAMMMRSAAVVIPFAIVLPAQLAIVKAFQQKKSTGKLSNADKGETDKENTSKKDKRIAKKPGRGHRAHASISNSISKKTGLPPPADMWPIIELAITRFARWSGSLHFGVAHFGLAPEAIEFAKERLQWNTLHAQKLFGTIISSLLVESRLVVNRRTLWGAFGAHIVFNAIARFSPLTRLTSAFVVGGLTEFHTSSIFIVMSIQFLLQQQLLWAIAGFCKKMEEELSDKEVARH